MNTHHKRLRCIDVGNRFSGNVSIESEAWESLCLDWNGKGENCFRIIIRLHSSLSDDEHNDNAIKCF